MNWLIISSMKTRPARPANVLVTALITSPLFLHRPGRFAERNARNQEEQHDDE